MATPLIFPLPDLELVFIEGLPKGDSFQMGGTDYDEEQPIHDVHIGYAFYMGRFLVTQQLYEEVIQQNPSEYQWKRRPVETVSWNDTKIFIVALEKMEAVKRFKKEHKLQEYAFRLPSEAEWEFAARGGIYNKRCEYCGSDDLRQVGWYDENSGGETRPVGLLLPNELGIYDMSGNVYEWCEDDWHNSYKEAPDDGCAWVNGINGGDRADFRVIRGGNYFRNADNCRPADRSLNSPADRASYLGFRLVLAPVQKQ